MFGLMLSCGGGSDDTTSEPEPVMPPLATTLIFPENNTECNEGEIISDTESRVTFRWNASEFTDSYIVHLTNLNTNVSRSEIMLVLQQRVMLLFLQM